MNAQQRPDQFKEAREAIRELFGAGKRATAEAPGGVEGGTCDFAQWSQNAEGL
jgi:hypothetical protein